MTHLYYPILKYGCFLKWWYPQIIHLYRVFPCKPSILGYHYFWKHWYIFPEFCHPKLFLTVRWFFFSVQAPWHWAPKTWHPILLVTWFQVDGVVSTWGWTGDGSFWKDDPGWFSRGLPIVMGPPYGKRDPPYYSHIFGDSYGSDMRIVWVRGPLLGVPEIPTEMIFWLWFLLLCWCCRIVFSIMRGDGKHWFLRNHFTALFAWHIIAARFQ